MDTSHRRENTGVVHQSNQNTNISLIIVVVYVYGFSVEKKREEIFLIRLEFASLVERIRRMNLMSGQDTNPAYYHLS